MTCHKAIRGQSVPWWGVERAAYGARLVGEIAGRQHPQEM